MQKQFIMGRKTSVKTRKDNPQKKQQWVEQLFPYFQKHGIKEVTMNEVADYLGKSKATIYKYFTSKEEIIANIVRYKLDEIRTFESLLTNQQLDFFERYLQSTTLLFKTVHDISNLFLAELQQIYPHIWVNISLFIQYTEHLLKSYYEEGMKNGKLNYIHPIILVRSDMLFFEEITNPDFLMNNGLTLEEAFQQYFKMKLLGMVRHREDVAAYF